MQITLDNAAIGRGLGAAVPELSLEVAPGAPTVIAVETDERPMLVSMLIGGRVKPDAGGVYIDGSEDLGQLRRRTALVDTPFVAEPSPGVSLATVVAEEFSFSGGVTSRSRVRTFLAEHGLSDYARVPIRALPAAHRVRVLSELALLRPIVDALVITSPERHGGSPAEWYEYLASVAERGILVVVVTDLATSDILTGLGARDAFIPASLES